CYSFVESVHYHFDLHYFPTRRSSDLVSTTVLTPFQAVLWAAMFNFAAYFIFKDHGVGETIAKTVREQIGLNVILSGLIAAIIWRSEEHTSELQSRENLVCRLLLEKKK